MTCCSSCSSNDARSMQLRLWYNGHFAQGFTFNPARFTHPCMPEEKTGARTACLQAAQGGRVRTLPRRSRRPCVPPDRAVGANLQLFLPLIGPPPGERLALGGVQYIQYKHDCGVVWGADPPPSLCVLVCGVQSCVATKSRNRIHPAVDPDDKIQFISRARQ